MRTFAFSLPVLLRDQREPVTARCKHGPSFRVELATSGRERFQFSRPNRAFESNVMLIMQSATDHVHKNRSIRSSSSFVLTRSQVAINLAEAKEGPVHLCLSIVLKEPDSTGAFTKDILCPRLAAKASRNPVLPRSIELGSGLGRAVGDSTDQAHKHCRTKVPTGADVAIVDVAFLAMMNVAFCTHQRVLAPHHHMSRHENQASGSHLSAHTHLRESQIAGTISDGS